MMLAIRQKIVTGVGAVPSGDRFLALGLVATSIIRERGNGVVKNPQNRLAAFP
jgi:hypothetical protein